MLTFRSVPLEQTEDASSSLSQDKGGSLDEGATASTILSTDQQQIEEKSQVGEDGEVKEEVIEEIIGLDSSSSSDEEG